MFQSESIAAVGGGEEYRLFHIFCGGAGVVKYPRLIQPCAHKL